jgi:hypothetical protein
MYSVKRQSERCSPRAPRSTALGVCALLAAGYAHCSPAEPSSQPTFKSAEEASHALFLAVQKGDERAVTNILGANTELVSSDDELEDQRDREQFVQKYQQMHRLVREAHGDKLLYIGAENWPFPVPLVSRNGAWKFDSDAGGQEVTYRRIGENEVTAIALCHELLAAARHPGTHETPAGVSAAVLADTSSSGNSAPLHGYYFRVLSTSSHGLAAVAYPAAYRSSGVMTFIINQDDVVREKDLGPDTEKLGRAVAAYPTDRGWLPAEAP